MERKFRLLYDFKAEAPTELPCKQGDIVTVAAGTREENGWIKVRSSRSGPGGTNITREGLVPASYVAEVIEPSAPKIPLRAPPPPPVVAPKAPSTEVTIKNVAVEHAECAICYDEMTARPSCVLLNTANKRSCRHFLHKECAQNLLNANQKLCPICRAPFVSVSDVPSFESNPKRWFDTVDANGDGTLSKGEVIEIMKATMAIDYRALEKNVDNLWSRWDKDGSGEIDFQELCDPKVGLLVYVRAHFARVQRAPPPELNARNLEVWFTYWDEDGNGSLEKEEIVRALIKTFKLSSSQAKMAEIRSTLDALWSIFDTDGSGEIELAEFIQRDGLGETLVASLSMRS